MLTAEEWLSIKTLNQKGHSQRKIAKLLKIIDSDTDYKWYVSKFYEKGSLDNYLDLCKGNLLKALSKIKPLVEGVAKLHGNNLVHRDITPRNVFLDSADNFVLDDFGLIYRTNDGKTRISGTYENVGSWDWMPQ